MNPSRDTLQEKLDELEQVKVIDELTIKYAIESLSNESSEEEPCPEWKYEVLAFNFAERFQDEDNDIYYTSRHRIATEDGETVEWPSTALVDRRTLDYWAQRATQTSNPVMRARYAGLVWELYRTVTGDKPDHAMAVTSCEAACEVAETDAYKHPLDAIKKGKRALMLGLALNDPRLTTRAKSAIIDLERRVAEDDKPGLWGFSFDLLLGEKKVGLSEKEEERLIEDLEGRLLRLKDGDPWACEGAALRLAKYYRAHGDLERCYKSIRTLDAAFESAGSKADALLASAWLEHMHEIFRNFGMNEDAKRVARRLRELGPAVRDSMKTISHQVEVSRAEIDEFVGKLVNGDLAEALARVAMYFVPRRDRIEMELRELANDAPLSMLIPKKITDEKGRTVAAIGPLDDDIDGNIIHHMSQTMSFGALSLRKALEGLTRKYSLNKESLLEQLALSPVFLEERKEILLEALEAYFAGNMITFIHVIVPQLESALRTLVEMVGGDVLELLRSGGFDLKALDKLLRDASLVDTLGEDIRLYVRVVLTDKRGWNLRNNVCHGLLPSDQYSETISDRLMHITILLGKLRVREDGSAA